MERRESAETLALEALGWLAGDPAAIGAFLAESGLAPAELAAAAGDPGFLAAVLDHVLAEEGRVLACAAALGVRPERFLPARAALPGGEAPHWT